jgi:four helix bundle protein
MKSEIEGEMKENIIVNQSFEFAVKIIQICKEMTDRKEYCLSRQLMRAGTSIGANVQEAQAAQTKRDFVCKMSIASKEARETRYWLMLIQKSELFPGQNDAVGELITKINDLINILTKIVKTAQKKC